MRAAIRRPADTNINKKYQGIFILNQPELPKKSNSDPAYRQRQRRPNGTGGDSPKVG
jgi:hypothetical protein